METLLYNISQETHLPMLCLNDDLVSAGILDLHLNVCLLLVSDPPFLFSWGAEQANLVSEKHTLKAAPAEGMVADLDALQRWLLGLTTKGCLHGQQLRVALAEKRSRFPEFAHTQHACHGGCCSLQQVSGNDALSNLNKSSDQRERLLEECTYPDRRIKLLSELKIIASTEGLIKYISLL